MDDDEGKSKQHNSSSKYTTPTFSWHHENTKRWDEMKVHPASGCKMTDTNIIHEDTNPCINEYHLSMRCKLDRAALDRDPNCCAPYYENYRICKRFWMRVVRDRKARGIKPTVPTAAEREVVKREYMQKEGFKP